MAINRDWIFEQCLSLTGSSSDFKEEWNAHRFLIDDKMFAMLGGDAKGIPILTLKAEPEMGELLRQQYPAIVPGYYMNKLHWNSIYIDQDVPEDLVGQMIRASHRLIFEKLPKKRQKEILVSSAADSIIQV